MTKFKVGDRVRRKVSGIEWKGYEFIIDKLDDTYAFEVNRTYGHNLDFLELVSSGEVNEVITEGSGYIPLRNQPINEIPMAGLHSQCLNITLPTHPAIRTITRREIVRGDYPIGTRSVYIAHEDVTNLLKVETKSYWYNAEELREMAHLFNQLAEVMQEREEEK